MAARSARSARFVLLLLLPIGCTGQAPPRVEFDGGAAFHVEIADDLAEQARGLMGRAELGSDRGMLFVWDDVAAREFWMKDTLIPLDLIAIEGDIVVSVQTMQPCERDPCPITTTAPADAALEVNAGTAASAGIEPGARVTIERGAT